MCNICTNCCSIVQYTRIIPSGSTVQIFTSVVNTPPPTPYLLHWVMRNWSGKKLPKGRAEVRLVQNTTLVFTRFEIRWGTPDPQWGPSAWHLTAHWPHTASAIQTVPRRCFSALTRLTSLEWLLSKVQEQLPRSCSGVARVKHTNCCICLRPPTLSLPQAHFRCFSTP